MDEADDAFGSSIVDVEDNIAAARVVGKQGRTSQKIQKALGVSLKKLDGGRRFEISGTETQRRVAAIIIRCVGQRDGDVILDEEDTKELCSTLEIPSSTTRMVLGKGGEHLRSIEEEADTVMFFGKFPTQGDTSRSMLLVYGNRPGRRLSKLLVMGLVESIEAGFFTKPLQEEGALFEDHMDLTDSWGTSVREFTDDNELAYAIGKNAHTRIKLMRASSCIIGRVGNFMLVSGYEEDRERALEYIEFLLQGRDWDVGFVAMADTDRADCSLLHIHDDFVAYITGADRIRLNSVEDNWGVMVFVLSERSEDGEQIFAIFGPVRGRCGARMELMSLIELQKPGQVTKSLSKSLSDEEGFAEDIWPLTEEEASYIQGKGAHMGATERKLSLASKAIVHLVGKVCIIAGELSERQCCRDYVEWLLGAKKGGKLDVASIGRSDLTVVHVTNEQKHLMQEASLQKIEAITETCIVLSEDRVLICGHDAGSTQSATGRCRAQQMVAALAAKTWQADWNASGSHENQPWKKHSSWYHFLGSSQSKQSWQQWPKDGHRMAHGWSDAKQTRFESGKPPSSNQWNSSNAPNMWQSAGSSQDTQKWGKGSSWQSNPPAIHGQKSVFTSSPSANDSWTKGKGKQPAESSQGQAWQKGSGWQSGSSSNSHDAQKWTTGSASNWKQSSGSSPSANSWTTESSWKQHGGSPSNVSSWSSAHAGKSGSSASWSNWKPPEPAQPPPVASKNDRKEPWAKDSHWQSSKDHTKEEWSNWKPKGGKGEDSQKWSHGKWQQAFDSASHEIQKWQTGRGQTQGAENAWSTDQRGHHKAPVVVPPRVVAPAASSTIRRLSFEERKASLKRPAEDLEASSKRAHVEPWKW